MTFPTPPGDNVPLYDGLDSSWNDVVSAFPEDKRAELAPILKSRVEEIQKSYEPLKQYEDFAKSNVSPEQLQTALKVYSTIENTPDQVYKMLGEYLGVSKQEAKQVVQEVQDANPDEDPRIATMQQQIETLMQIKLAEHQQTKQQRIEQEQEQLLERELGALRKKYGEVDEDEILMRMMHRDLTAEQAYQEYSNKVSELRRTRPAPMIMGQGGQIPRNAIDPTKLDSKDTKSLVAQMMAQANNLKNQ